MDRRAMLKGLAAAACAPLAAIEAAAQPACCGHCIALNPDNVRITIIPAADWLAADECHYQQGASATAIFNERTGEWELWDFDPGHSASRRLGG